MDDLLARHKAAGKVPTMAKPSIVKFPTEFKFPELKLPKFDLDALFATQKANLAAVQEAQTVLLGAVDEMQQHAAALAAAVLVRNAESGTGEGIVAADAPLAELAIAGGLGRVVPLPGADFGPVRHLESGVPVGLEGLDPAFEFPGVLVPAVAVAAVGDAVLHDHRVLGLVGPRYQGLGEPLLGRPAGPRRQVLVGAQRQLDVPAVPVDPEAGVALLGHGQDPQR